MLPAVMPELRDSDRLAPTLVLPDALTRPIVPAAIMPRAVCPGAVSHAQQQTSRRYRHQKPIPSPAGRRFKSDLRYFFPPHLAGMDMRPGPASSPVGT